MKYPKHRHRGVRGVAHRWTGDWERPGVQAVAAGYAVVTANERTEHRTFAEAAEIYWLRRKGQRDLCP